jgi:hypothetical protein
MISPRVPISNRPGTRFFQHVSFCIGDGCWSSFLGLLCSGPTHAFSFELDAVSVVNETIEDGVGVSGIADNFVPAVDGKLGSDHRGAASVAFLEDF